jgi:hypothetical protein
MVDGKLSLVLRKLSKLKMNASFLALALILTSEPNAPLMALEVSHYHLEQAATPACYTKVM